MAPSDRFKPIQKIASHSERKAAAALGESIKQRDAAQQRLDDLTRYLDEYLGRFERAARSGLSSTQVLEYQVFIGKLETAIAQQRQVVARTEQDCDSSKAAWRGRYTHAKAMDNVVERMQDDERRDAARKEQLESDDRSQRRR